MWRIRRPDRAPVSPNSLAELGSSEPQSSLRLGGLTTSAKYTDAMSDEPLVVYSDYVCPFCYLGRASMNQYLEDADDPPDVEWRFFDLRGHKRGSNGEIREDLDDGKDDAYYQRARENVQRLQEEYGVEMTVDLATGVDSFGAQQAALFVKKEYGEATFKEFHDAVFDALWQDGRDIGDPAVLAEIGESVGVESGALEAAVEDSSLEAELLERFSASKSAGVTGIPTFVYGDYVARGAVPPAQLRRLVEGP